MTSALNSAHYNADEKTMVLDDPFANVLDVAGVNEYIGWCTLRPEDADSVRWVLPKKPVLFSEFGAEARYGNHGGADQRWTEEQQYKAMEHRFVMLNKVPQMRGVIPWILMDFRSPGRNIPKVQPQRASFRKRREEASLQFSPEKCMPSTR